MELERVIREFWSRGEMYAVDASGAMRTVPLAVYAALPDEDVDAVGVTWTPDPLQALMLSAARRVRS